MVITVTLNPAIDKVLEVPGFSVGAHARAAVRLLLPAGKGNNVARGIVRLGGAAEARGLVGRGEERLFTESLRAEGVEPRFTAVDGLTRTNTTVLDPDAHTTTHLREPGLRVCPGDVAAIRDALARRIAELSPDPFVLFAGSVPAGCGPADFAGLLEACADQGARLVVDTNGPPLRAAVETGRVDTIKPNEEELAECLGYAPAADTAGEAAAGLLDRVGTVLLTLGARGALLVRPGLVVGRRCPLRDDEVRNTTGCGDAFLAGWLAAVEVGLAPDEALGRAVAAGGAAATGEATVSYTVSDVEGLLARCEPFG
jgi:1-phosphofructokinase